MFLYCRPFGVITFSTGFVGVEVTSVFWLGDNKNCQLPKPGDRSNFNIHKICLKCCYSNERPTGQKHTYIRWDDGGNKGKTIN